MFRLEKRLQVANFQKNVVSHIRMSSKKDAGKAKNKYIHKFQKDGEILVCRKNRWVVIILMKS